MVEAACASIGKHRGDLMTKYARTGLAVIAAVLGVAWVATEQSLAEQAPAPPQQASAQDPCAALAGGRGRGAATGRASRGSGRHPRGRKSAGRRGQRLRPSSETGVGLGGLA